MRRNAWFAGVVLGAGVLLALGCGGGGGGNGEEGSPDNGAQGQDAADGTCTPGCEDKECGDDGCGGTCGQCGDGKTCSTAGKCECAPKCEGKDCGDDGCGGSCGQCTAGECTGEGKCEACEPACTDKECGDDGCGSTCGECTPPGECNEAGECACTPQCEGKQCGTDGCGGSCGECPGGVCLDGGVCCTPSCAGKSCGDDGCGGSCGTCAEGTTCTPESKCKVTGGKSCEGACGDYASGDACQCDSSCFGFGDCCLDLCSFCGDLPEFAAECGPCVPACDGKVCGDDGCGGTCGECASGQSCAGGACVTGTCDGSCGSKTEAGCWCDSACFGYGDCCADICDFCAEDYPEKCCKPDCTGKACGNDGCGGSCGECGAGKACGTDFTCVDASTIEGNTCGNPFAVAELPFEAKADTFVGSNDFAFDDGLCKGESYGTGEASNDHVYTFTTTEAGIYTITLAAAFDTALYLATDCDSIGTSCVAASTGYGKEALQLDLPSGTQYFVFVDGHSGLANEAGAYALTISKPCVPDCAGKECGSDGCIGTCGKCEGDLLCDLDQICVDPSAVAGNTCENPFVVGPVPFEGTGNTMNASGLYATGSDDCPGMGAKGAASFDQVWAITPAVTGVYPLELDGEFDTALYVVSDCGHIADSCLGGQESYGTEELEVKLQAGTTYYIIVDGYSNDDNKAGPYTLTIGEPCIPECDGKECGDDGCGMTCGKCVPGDICGDDQLCVDGTTIEGNTCANPFTVGAVPFEATGDTTGMGDALFYGDGQCPGETYGAGDTAPDNVYELTPGSTGGYTVTLDGDFDTALYVVEDCASVPTSCVATDEGFGVETVDVWLEGGTTYYIVVDGYNDPEDAGTYSLKVEACTPECGDKVCGDNGCGGSCGECGDLQACVSGKCLPLTCDGSCAKVSPAGCSCAASCFDDGNCCPDICDFCGASYGAACACEPSCDGKTCGSDGCFGTCGKCEKGTFCSAFQACELPADLPGQTCDDPIQVPAIPFWSSANTAGATNDFSVPSGKCPGVTSSKGKAGKDLVYELVPTVTGVYTVSVKGSFDAALYLAKTCEAIGDSCLGASDKSGKTEVLSVMLQKGVAYYIVVDGWSDSTDYSGPFTLSIGEPCVPECSGKTCGPDGCGMQCGKCADGQACGTDGACAKPADAVGNTCETAMEVDGLPFEAKGSTAGATSFAQFSDDSCPGETYGQGGASSDHFYTFTPGDTDSYKVAVEADYDSTVYVFTDCADIDDTCLGASNQSGNDIVYVELTAGTTYTIAVDGYGNSTNSAGNYTLTVDVCVPSCDGKACGDDGCGGDCGGCDAGEECVDDACLVATCAGSCGSFSTPFDCHCDAACFGYADCCDDICDECADMFSDKCGP